MLRAKKVRVIQGHFLDSFPFGAHYASPSAAPIGYWQEVGREVHTFWGMKAWGAGRSRESLEPQQHTVNVELQPRVTGWRSLQILPAKL